MTHPIDPYRSSHLCSLHAAAPPPCPRCAAEWSSSAEAHRTPKAVGRIFIAGLFAATVFGAAIGTGIGFAAGASPFWIAGPPATSPPPNHEVQAQRGPEGYPSPRSCPAPPAVPASLVGRVGSTAIGPPVAALTPVIARLGGAREDPEAIASRLQALSLSGMPLTIENRRLSPAVRQALLHELSLPRPRRLLPVERDGRIVGVQVFGVRPGSALEWAGVRNADVVLAVNGVDMDGREGHQVWPFPGDARTAVVELERSGENIALVLRW